MPSDEILNLNFEEMTKSGIPVKRGVRQFHIEDKTDGRSVASALWVHRWAKHAAMNYPTVSQGLGVKAFQDAASHLPCFCVGIGPSLDNSIKDLKVSQKRAIIIATDAAIKPLLANGITPHIALTFDCGENQKTLIQDIPVSDQNKILMFLNSCTHPSMIEAWKGPKAYFNQYHQRDEFIAKLLPYIYPNLGQLPSAGTVGNMLVMLAHYLGMKSIHLVGMDLAYGLIDKQEGALWKYRAQDYSFSDGAWIKKDNQILYENDSRVMRSFDEEIEGVKYRVDPELKMYREALVEICKAVGIFPIDCSGGTLRRFFPSRSVKECVMLHCRGEIPKYRTVLTNVQEFFGETKIFHNQSITGTWATVKNLSETCKEAVVYGNGA